MEPDQRGLGPLAVQELAKEFRRLAKRAEGEEVTGPVKSLAEAYKGGVATGAQMAMEQAALMLEEKLSGSP